MTREEFHTYALSKPEAELTFPFGPEADVFKVGGKIFAIVSDMKGELGANLKCEPDEAFDLRSQFEGISPGYHMNKEHWNTVSFDSDVTSELFEYLIDNSYLLIIRSLKKAERERFRIVHGIDRV